MKTIYELPFDIGDELYFCTCLGIPYTIDEINKCKGWKVEQIKIRGDGIYFDLSKGKDNSTGMIPLSDYGVVVFDNESDAKNALVALNAFRCYCLENGLECLETKELMARYLIFRDKIM